MDSHCRPSSRLLPWLAWGVSSLFVFFQMFLQSSPSVMITDLQKAFSLDTLGVSLLASSFFYTYLLFQIPSGMVLDRIAPRYCLIFCLVGISISTLVFANAHDVGAARMSRIFQGVFSAPSVVPAMCLAAAWFPSRQFALLAGLTEMIGMSGSAIGQLILAPVSGSFGWRMALFTCALLGFVLMIVTWLAVRNPPVSQEPIQKSERKIFRGLLTVIAYPQAWINGLFSGLLFAISGAFFSFWSVPYVIETYHVSLNIAAAASSMGLFGVALGAPVMGALSDRLGVRRLPMVFSTIIVLALMLIILYVPSLSLPVLFGLFFLLGLFSGVYMLAFAVMRDVMPANIRGTAMSFTNMMSILIGAPLLQPLIGWLLNMNLNTYTNKVVAYQHSLLVLPICAAIGLVFTFLMEETYCGRQEAQSESSGLASFITSSK